MALHGNYSILHKSPAKYTTGTVGYGERSNWNKHGMVRSSLGKLEAVPYGYNSGAAWVLPKTAGAVSTRGTVRGDGNFLGSGALGVNASASMAGDGTISSAVVVLLLSAIADLSGNGALDAEAIGRIDAAVNMLGDGDLIASIRGLANTFSSMYGDGSLSGDGVMSIAANAALSGNGTITEATVNLIGVLSATLTGSGTLTGSVVLKLEAAAAMAGAGNLAGAISALANLTIDILGAGALSGVPRGVGSASMNIRGYGDLTPEGIRDSVWQANSASYDALGTMGAKLNDAGGGSSPEAIAAAVWAFLIESGFSADEVLRIIAAHAAGSATGLEGANPQFKGLDGTTTRIDGTYVNGVRTINNLNGDV